MFHKIKYTIKSNYVLNTIWSEYDWIRTKYLLTKDLKAIPNKIYRRVFKRDIDWVNPKNLIEKIYWLQIYSDTTLWSRCSDKFEVRSYLEEKGCKDLLNTLYGKWDSVEEINWDELPDSFVLKTNNSCGKVILVKNKKDLNIQETSKKLKSWMNLKYGFRDGQLHYTAIKPCIIAEELLVNRLDSEKSLIDYKIWCFNGIPECVLVVFNRTEDNYLLSSYDLNWNNISENSFKKGNKHFNGKDLPKPKSFNQMLECAKKLSEGIPQVRIDFYDIDEKAIFGEMTFSTGFGYYSEEFYNYLGDKIDLKKIKKNDQPKKVF